MVLPTSVSMSGITGATLIGAALQHLHMGDELATLRAADRGCAETLTPNVWPAGLPFADAFDLRRVQGIDIRPALALLLLAHGSRFANAASSPLLPRSCGRCRGSGCQDRSVAS